jgi:hypothetical protein
MFQGLDVVVAEQLSQPVPQVHRQDGGERIELMRPPGFRIDGEGRGGGVRSVMISVRLFPGDRAVDGTDIAAGWLVRPLLQRLGVPEAAVGLTVPDPLPVILAWRISRHAVSSEISRGLFAREPVPILRRMASGLLHLRPHRGRLRLLANPHAVLRLSQICFRRPGHHIDANSECRP